MSVGDAVVSTDSVAFVPLWEVPLHAFASIIVRNQKNDIISTTHLKLIPSTSTIHMKHLPVHLNFNLNLYLNLNVFMFRKSKCRFTP